MEGREDIDLLTSGLCELLHANTIYLMWRRVQFDYSGCIL
jgi:hypothetical protein